jgi:hypothetical protein
VDIFNHEQLLNIYSKLNKCSYEITPEIMIEKFPSLKTDNMFSHDEINKDATYGSLGLSFFECKFRTPLYNVTWDSVTEQIKTSESSISLSFFLKCKLFDSIVNLYHDIHIIQ